MTTQIIRRPEVRRRTSLSDSTLERLERRGAFPRRRRLGPYSVGWVESEVTDWIESRPAVNDGPEDGAA